MRSETDRICYFGPIFELLPPNNPKIKIFKKWKKHLEMSSFYTYALKITIKWCMLPEIWSVKDIFFCHFGPFLALSSQLLTPKIKIWKNVKNTWRCYAFTHVYHKWRSHDVWFLRYKAEFFVILGHFLPFDPPNSPKNQNFEKNEKKTTTTGDITILHMCFINENHMMYGSWDMERDRQNFFSLTTFFLFIYPLTTQKIRILKNEKNAWRYHLLKFTINDNHMMHGSWDMCHFGLFFALLPR